MTAHITVNRSKYGTRQGYIVFAVGFGNFFAKTIKAAKDWCTGHGLDFVMV